MPENRWSDDPNDPLAWHLDEAKYQNKRRDPLRPEWGDRYVLMSRAAIKELIAAAISHNNSGICRHIRAVEEIVTTLGEAMGAREDAARARHEELVGLVKEGWLAKDAENRVLREQLANADASAQARVDAALEADSDFDAEKVEAGNSALEELLSSGAPAEEPAPVEEPPADPAPSTDGDAPAEGEQV